jgi:hypothetical protein
MPYNEELAARVAKNMTEVPGMVEKKMFGGIGYLGKLWLNRRCLWLYVAFAIKAQLRRLSHSKTSGCNAECGSDVKLLRTDFSLPLDRVASLGKATKHYRHDAPCQRKREDPQSAFPIRPALPHDGNMSIGTHRDALMVRVGLDAYEDCLAHPGARVMDFTGRVMKGWVTVPMDYAETDEQVQYWIRRSLEFVTTLPAKKLCL